jgi:hypothetical protein
VPATLDLAKPLHALVARYLSSTSERVARQLAQTPPLSLDVRVSDGVRERALWILDALFKALEARGMPLESRMPRPRMSSRGHIEPVQTWSTQEHRKATCVTVGDQDVLLTIREFQKQVKPTPAESTKSGKRNAGRQITSAAATSIFDHPRQELLPSGRLTLSIPHRIGNWGPFATWSDPKVGGAGLRLEDQLNEVILGVVEAAEEYRRVIARWKSQLEAEHHAAALAAERERIRIRDNAIAKEIEQQATSWQLASSIREFVAEYRAQQPSNDTGKTTKLAQRAASFGMTVEEWLNWAEAHASRLDPFGIH